MCSWFMVTHHCATLNPFNPTQKLFFFFMFQEHRNLSQLPNFAFSCALCHFHLSQQEDLDAEEACKQKQQADQMLQGALIMFPGGQNPHSGVICLTRRTESRRFLQQ